MKDFVNYKGKMMKKDAKTPKELAFAIKMEEASCGKNFYENNVHQKLFEMKLPEDNVKKLEKKTRRVSIARASVSTKDHKIGYFRTILDKITELKNDGKLEGDPQGWQVWNMDELGHSMDAFGNYGTAFSLHSTSKTPIFTLSSSEKDQKHISIIPSFSASGELSNRWHIVHQSQSKNFMPQAFVSNLPHSFSVSSTPSGFADDVSMQTWCTNFADEMVYNRKAHNAKPNASILLFTDGWCAHTNPPALRFLLNNNIHVIFEPPETSMTLQAADNGLMKIIRETHGAILSEWRRSTAIVPLTVDLANLHIADTWQRMKDDNYLTKKLQTAWNKTEIWPLDNMRELIKDYDVRINEEARLAEERNKENLTSSSAANNFLNSRPTLSAAKSKNSPAAGLAKVAQLFGVPAEDRIRTDNHVFSNASLSVRKASALTEGDETYLIDYAPLTPGAEPEKFRLAVSAITQSYLTNSTIIPVQDNMKYLNEQKPPKNRIKKTNATDFDPYIIATVSGTGAVEEVEEENDEHEPKSKKLKVSCRNPCGMVVSAVLNNLESQYERKVEEERVKEKNKIQREIKKAAIITQNQTILKDVIDEINHNRDYYLDSSNTYENLKTFLRNYNADLLKQTFQALKPKERLTALSTDQKKQPTKEDLVKVLPALLITEYNEKSSALPQLQPIKISLKRKKPDTLE